VGEGEIGRGGDWESGRVGEGERGRVGEWESGRVGKIEPQQKSVTSVIKSVAELPSSKDQKYTE